MTIISFIALSALLQLPPGSIGGVVRTQTGDPVARAAVTLKQDGQQAAITMLTGGDGSFLFSSIPAGQYRLTARRNGYMDTEYGKHSRDTAGSAITLAPGANRTDLNLTMIPFGAISGRITDSDGEPVGAVTVDAFRYSYSDGQRTLTQVKSVSTNDRGEYRLFWLPPGRYYVRCGGANSIFITTAGAGVIVHGAIPDDSGTRPKIVPTYFPGTPDPQRASSIDLQPGADYGGVDFPVNPSIGRRVRVTVGNAEQSPPPALKLVPRNAAGAMDVQGSGTINGVGQFTLVPPGSYTVIATANASRGGNTDIKRTGASIPVEVGDQDVDVTMNLQPSVDIAGHVTIEGLRDGTPVDSHPIVSVLTQGARTNSQGITDFADFHGNDVFNIADLIEGDYSVLVEEIPQTQYLKSVRYGSADVLTDGLHVDSRSGGTLDVVLAANGATVTGMVTGTDRQPAANVAVTLVPDESRRNRDDLYKKVSTDSTGHFSVQGIAPGDYTIFAWDNLDPSNLYDMDFVRRFEPRGQAVHLGELGTQNVELTAIPDAY